VSSEQTVHMIDTVTTNHNPFKGVRKQPEMIDMHSRQ
jgi:hypothetical protein